MKEGFKFENIAKAMKDLRMQQNVSQTYLASVIGYKNGQFVSNVERGLCSVPPSKLALISKEFKCSVKALIDAIVKDTEAHVIREIRLESEKHLMHLDSKTCSLQKGVDTSQSVI